ncbi:MAG: single-stranded DNA-binding protein [Bacteroidetes bacterium]|nr:single-stranded DNA-binding protein [Bacteroidota bacterium]
MANGVNKVILIGNLGKDPEIMTLDNGVKRATFSLATTESFKTKDGSRTSQTEWHTVILWRGLAEVAEQYLKKGYQIYLEGRIRTRSWDDKDGNKRYTTEIVGDNMTMLSRPTGQGHTEEHAAVPEVQGEMSSTPPTEPDDLPF